MWNDSQDIARQALQTDFVQGIKHGNLDPTCYGTFNVSDIYYCYKGAAITNWLLRERSMWFFEITCSTNSIVIGNTIRALCATRIYQAREASFPSQRR